MSLNRPDAIFIIVAVLAGCGGGNGSGGGDGQTGAIDARLNPPQLAVNYNAKSFFLNGQSNEVPLQIAISNNAPAATLAFVTGDAAILSVPQLPLDSSAAGFYANTIKFRPDLAPGNYSGSLRLRLCKEISCETEYPVVQPSIPYQITVTSEVEFKIEGAPIGQTRVPTLATDRPVTVTSNLPVTWVIDPDTPMVKVLAQTPTTWTAMFSAKSLSGEGQFGGFVLTATPVSPTSKAKIQPFGLFYY